MSGYMPQHKDRPASPLFALAAGFLKGRLVATLLKSSVYRHFQSRPPTCPRMIRRLQLRTRTLVPTPVASSQ
jgi:hypothetical protein